MQAEQKRHEAFSALLGKKNRWGKSTAALLAAAAVLWSVTFLVNLDFVRELGLMKVIDAWLDETGWVRTVLDLLRYGTALGGLAAVCMYIKYAWQYLIRRNMTGEPAPLDETVADEAMQQLEALRNAAGRDSFLEARDDDVRVQVLAPAVDIDRRDYLVHWDDDGNHEIDLGGGRYICLALGRYGEPCIMGQTNEGTDAAPLWREHLYPLQPHVPRIIVRGDGAERRIRYAITRLGGGKG